MKKICCSFLFNSGSLFGASRLSLQQKLNNEANVSLICKNEMPHFMMEEILEHYYIYFIKINYHRLLSTIQLGTYKVELKYFRQK